MSVWREPLYWNGLITGTLFWCVVWLLALMASWWHDRRKAAKPKRAAKRSVRGWWRDRFAVDFEPEWSYKAQLSRFEPIIYEPGENDWPKPLHDDTVEQEPIR